MSDQAIVEVLDDHVHEKGGSFKNDAGEDVSYTTRKQDARLEVGGFAYPFSVRLEDGQAAYPKGRYRLAIEHMLQVNKGVASLSKFTRLAAIGASK